jgi:HK97 family phage prohead protease
MTVNPLGDMPNEEPDDEGSSALAVRVFTGRSYVLQDCTVRADGDGRIVEAYAAAFNAPSEIRDQDGHYNEIIAPGSFNKTIADNGVRFGVFYNHGMSIHGTPDGALSVPIGVPVEAPRADEHGVLTVTRYLDNPLADSVLDAIKQRAITGQSFSGRFMRSERTRSTTRGGLPTITRREVAMREYGPTVFPAYAAAHIVGTRSADAFLRDLLALDAVERAELFAQMTALITRAEPEPVSAQPTTTEPVAGPAVEPREHSPRQDEVARRARVARILRGDRQ